MHMQQHGSAFTGEFFVPGCSGKWSEALHYARYRFASQYAKGKSVLDIACGVGYGSHQLALAGASSVVGVDILADNVSFAQRSYRLQNLHFVQGDITSFGEDQSYDLIVCFETIEHVAQYNRALHNCRRLLRNKGCLIISSPDRRLSSPRNLLVTDRPENPFHVREFTLSELLLALEANGFSADETRYFGPAYQPVFPSMIITKAFRKLIVRPFASKEVRLNRHRWLLPNYFTVVAEAQGE